MIELHPLEPSASQFQCHWRWTAAEKLVRFYSEPPGQAKTDRFIYEAFLYQRAKLVARHDPRLIEELDEEFKDLTEAQKIYAINLRDIKWMLEAMIVGNATYEQIHEYFPIARGVVERYEALFFDVRKYLGYRGFIIHNLLSPALNHGIPTDPDMQWKMVAALGGVTMLKRYLDIDSDLDPIEFQQLSRLVRKNILQHTWLASMNLDATGQNSIPVVELHNEFETAYRASQESVGGSHPMRDFINGLVASVGSLIGQPLVLPENVTGRVAVPRSAEAFKAQLERRNG